MKFFVTFSIVLIACLLRSAYSQASLVITSSDTSAATTSAYPIAVSLSGATAVSVTATPSTNLAAPSGTTGTYTAKGASGFSMNQVWTLTQASSSPSAISFTVAVTVGPQVILTVAVTPPTGGTAGTSQSASTGVVAAGTTCGNYYLDCAGGVLTFAMYVPGTASVTCVVTINQVAGVSGILQYPTATVPTTSTVTSAITSASGVALTPTICATTTPTGTTNTLYYFYSSYPASVSTSSAQTTAFNSLTAAAKAGTISGNTAYTTYNAQPSASAGVAAPSASASNLSAIVKSARNVASVAGFLVSVVALTLGLTL